MTKPMPLWPAFLADANMMMVKRPVPLWFVVPIFILLLPVFMVVAVSVFFEEALS